MALAAITVCPSVATTAKRILLHDAELQVEVGSATDIDMSYKKGRILVRLLIFMRPDRLRVNCRTARDSVNRGLSSKMQLLGAQNILARPRNIRIGYGKPRIGLPDLVCCMRNTAVMTGSKVAVNNQAIDERMGS